VLKRPELARVDREFWTVADAIAALAAGVRP